MYLECCLYFMFCCYHDVMNPFVRASSNTLMSSLRVITDRKLWKAPLHVFCILTCILECCKDCLEIGYRGVAWRLSLFGYSVDFSCRKSASVSRKIRGLWQTNEKEALGGWEPDGPFGCIFRHVAGGRCPLVGLKVWRVRHWFWSPTIWMHIFYLDFESNSKDLPEHWQCHGHCKRSGFWKFFD